MAEKNTEKKQNNEKQQLVSFSKIWNLRLQIIKTILNLTT